MYTFNMKVLFLTIIWYKYDGVLYQMLREGILSFFVRCGCLMLHQEGQLHQIELTSSPVKIVALPPPPSP